MRVKKKGEAIEIVTTANSMKNFTDMTSLSLQNTQLPSTDVITPNSNLDGVAADFIDQCVCND